MINSQIEYVIWGDLNKNEMISLFENSYLTENETNTEKETW